MSIEFTNAASKYAWVDRTPFEINGPLTVSLWLYVKTLTAWNGIYTMGLNSGINLFMTDGIKLRSFVREKTPIRWQFNDSTNNINANQWYHVCQVVTADNMHLYIDGVDQEAISPGGYGGDINYPDVYDWRISGYNDQEFDGMIEDLAYWNKELSIAQILLLAKSYKKRIPLQIQPANLMLYLPFDEANIGAAYGTAYDWSGNGRNATPSGPPIGAKGILSYPSKIVMV